MATLKVETSFDFTGTVLDDITEIEFDDDGVPEVATFDASQFDDVQISTSVQILGEFHPASTVRIEGISGIFTAAEGFSFAVAAQLVLVGGGAADLIIANSSSFNRLQGNGGADQLIGAGFSNSFVYLAPSHISAGEELTGSFYTFDAIEVAAGGGTYDFTVAEISLVSTLVFTQGLAATVAEFRTDQVRAGKIFRIVDSSDAANTLAVRGSQVDLSGLQFESWSAQDTVRIDGTSGADNLLGSTQSDTIFGGAGSDTLDGAAGADSMSGGTGDDTFVVDNAGDKVIEPASAALARGAKAVAASEGVGDHVMASVDYTLGANVENLTLTGNGGIDGAGNGLGNVIKGNAGANRINGGAGQDVLTGGTGPDTFVFDAAVKPKKIAAANADTITDFNPAEDTIELAAAVFSKLKVGVLKNKAFGSGTKKPGKDKKLVYYQEKTGDLWYDANGKKQKGKGDVLIATLDPGLDLTKADIVVA